MKVSEIQADDVVKFLKLDEEDGEVAPILDAAKDFIRNYTGLEDKEIDTHEDFYIAAMVLCQDMYDNRRLYVETQNLNQVVKTILGMHRVNLL